jgi:hypothetical protein
MLCHTIRAGSNKEDFVLLTEYTTWRLHDKHSLAYAVLEGSRGQKILRTLHRSKPDEKIDATKERACLNCHALNFPDRIPKKPELALKDGVSCETCHGPSEKWFSPHSDASGDWRLLSGEEKYSKFGMYDVRDPVRRAELCFSCHIGNPAQGKVVTHAMFAAGHPPLRSMEASTFSDNMPRHWRLLKDVPYFQQAEARLKEEIKPEERKQMEQVVNAYRLTTKDFQQSQLTLATSTIGLRRGMQMVAERADFKAELKPAEVETRWPELGLKDFDASTDLGQRWPELAMAHADCYGCHHELQIPSWRQQRGYVGKPGRPQVRPWPMILAKLGVYPSEARPASGPSLSDRLQQLSDACSAQPFGDPRQLLPAAQTVANWPQHQEDLKNVKVNRLELLNKLSKLPEDEYPDFESARQIVSAIRVLYDEREPKAKMDSKFNTALGTLEDQLNIRSLASARQRRIRLFVKLLADVAGVQDLTKEPKLIEALDKITSQGFDEALRLEPETRKALQQFFNTTRSQDPQELTAAFYDEKRTFLKDLEAISDEEFEANSKKMLKYDPSTFKDALKRLTKIPLDE